MAGWLVVLALHQASGLLAARPGVSSSRRLLASALVALLPVVGPPLAWLVRMTHGLGRVAAPELAVSTCRRLAPSDIAAARDLPSLLDRVLSRDAGERLAALVALTADDHGDADAIALLRWTVAHGCAEAVLDAALTLEALELRREELVAGPDGRPLVLAVADADAALAAGDAAAAGIVSGLAEPASWPQLALRARAAYRRAARAAPAAPRLALILRVARVELALGCHQRALAALAKVSPADADHPECLALRARARFALRHFDDPAAQGSEP